MQLLMEDTLDRASFKGFTQLIYQLTGITIKEERKMMLIGRLRRRVHALGLPGFREYLDYVRLNKNEHETFINQVTTNETYFFRTPRIWDYIETSFLPSWQLRSSKSILRVWSAAASSGEEAYSLGVILQQFKEQNSGFDYRIQGTDIDTSVISRAATGLYQGRAIERFRCDRPEWFRRFMTGSDADSYSVVPAIRSRIQFDHFNLFDTSPASTKYDLVLLRNVLIYFAASDQESVMSTIYKRMHPQGTAIIGESETLNNINTDFEPLAPTIYKPVPASALKTA